MFKGFREFAMRGNIIDVAVGIIIGAAFVTVVQSVVNDIIMPPIGLLLGNLDFSSLMIVLKQGAGPGPYATPAQAKAAGAVTLNYGTFINNIISFLIVAYAVFLIVRAAAKLQREKPAPAPATKECPFCRSTIPVNAIRCAFCTSELKG